MFKNLLYIFIITLSLLLSGCGSNDIIDDGSRSSSSAVKMQKESIVLGTSGADTFSLYVPFVKQYDSDIKVELKNFSLTVDTCGISTITYTPIELSLEGGKYSVETLAINGKFTSSCVPTGYTLQYTETITKSGHSETSTIIENNDYTAGPDSSGDSRYAFYNVKAPLEISTTSKGYDIGVQLVYDNRASVGKSVSLKVFDNSLGDVSSYSAVTGSDGYAMFTYTSPEVLPPNGTLATLTAIFDDEQNVTIEKNIVLMFNTNAVVPYTGESSATLVVVPDSVRNTALTNNSQNIEIEIRVYKDTAPYDAGDVKVQLPSEVLNGIDVGTFASYVVPVSAQGIALFHYTGPSNLKALIDGGHAGAEFKFYHTENSSVDDRQPMMVSYQPDSSYVPVNYQLSVSTQDNDFSMGIPDVVKTFNVILKNSDGSAIDSNSITVTKITARSENALVAELYDSSTQTNVNSMTLQNMNNSPFILKSKNLSGIVPITITMEFTDINNESKTLSTSVNVRVLSGPPTALSISYVSTGQDADRAKYVERFAITATDEYGNNVNTKPYISIGAIAGYTVDGSSLSAVESSTTKRLFYGKTDIETGVADGEISGLADSDPSTTRFMDYTIATDVFKYVNSEGSNTDKLVVFGIGKKYEAMGKWDFSKIDNHTLKLEDDYYGSDRSGLYYAIGRNYYKDQCREDGREWVGSTDSPTYQLDDEGTVIVSYKYDYHLSGKDVLVWVNLNGTQPDTGANTRIGEVLRHTLRTTGLESLPNGGYSVPKGTSTTGTFTIHHENAPEWYRNARFGWRIKSGSTCTHSLISTSNNLDARTCYNGGSGVSYISFVLTAPADKDCTFALDYINVSSEF